MVRVNQFEKAPLISTEGYTYEKAIVVAITKDNLAEDGNRCGTQEVVVQIKSGELKELFFSLIHVGRDMMGTMTNTLIFAYVGGSLTTLITNYAYDLSYQQLANSYVIGIEIMQGLSGSLGVVLTVPITAALAAFFIGRKKERIEKNRTGNS